MAVSPQPVPVRILTLADDLGSTRSTNVVSEKLLKLGTIRNASVMVVGPELADAANRLRGGGFCVGLHFTITRGIIGGPLFRPVLDPAKVPGLVNEQGYFLDRPYELHERGVNLDEVRAELEAQWETLQRTGVEIRYVDDHMGVSWLGENEVGRMLREFCAEKDVIFAPCSPSDVGDDEPCRLIPGEFRNLLKGLDAEGVRSFAKTVQPGTYLWITYPVEDTPETCALFGTSHVSGKDVVKVRAAEARLFESAAMRDFLGHPRVRAIRYDEL